MIDEEPRGDAGTSFTVNGDFSAPPTNPEDSVIDDDIVDPTPEPMTVQYEIVEGGTSRGNRKLVDDRGFTYTERVRL